jgi:tetratricopeptide (TPR) repeat protein
MRQFQLTPWRIVDLPDPDVQMYANFHTGSPVALANYSNPELDKLLEHARTTADTDKRIEDYCAISRLINQEAIWFWTFQNTYYAISSARLKGLPKQLVDTIAGRNLWADWSDGELEDIFDLQDRVTAGVVGQLAPKLEQVEIERTKAKPTESLDAYDYYLRGIAHTYRYSSRDSINEALRLFYRAIELDPDYASAYGMAARCYAQRKASGWMIDREKEIAEAARLAHRAGELGKDDALALCTAGIALAYVVGDLDNAAAFTDRAILLNPNLAWAWLFSGWVRAFLGEPDVAIEHQARAMRLSPLDPTLYNMQTGTALAHLLAGRFDDASSWSERAFRDQPNYLLAAGVVAASNALAGRQEKAQEAMARLQQLDPTARVSNLKDYIPLRRSEDFANFAEGLRMAGLPE